MILVGLADKHLRFAKYEPTTLENIPEERKLKILKMVSGKVVFVLGI